MPALPSDLFSVPMTSEGHDEVTSCQITPLHPSLLLSWEQEHKTDSQLTQMISHSCQLNFCSYEFTFFIPSFAVNF